MGLASLLLLGACAFNVTFAFSSMGKSDSVLRDVVDRIGRALDRYMEDASPRLFPQDYQDGLSLRDAEYLQHSSLWGIPFPPTGDEESMRMKPDDVKQRTKQDRNNLPAYCNPPNPCPIGYTGKEGCLEEFENTAAFSREFQARQECMCDTEHMFECSASPPPDDMPDIDRFVHEFQIDDEHKSLVAKKFHGVEKSNPYLEGEKLPIAAKKGQYIV